jgi:hypothetical protein
VDGGGYFVVFAAIAATQYGLAYWRSPKRRIQRALARLPATAVAGAPDGRPLRITGVVEGRLPPLTSPLTGRSCCYYCIVVEEKNGRSWKEILREERGVDFQVRDDSGTALVRPTQLGRTQAALVPDETREISLLMLDDERLERFLTERGRPTRGLLLQRNIRAKEGILVAGKRVVVGGLARWEADGDGGAAGYRQAAQRLTLAAWGESPLLISDYPAAFGRR